MERPECGVLSACYFADFFVSIEKMCVSEKKVACKFNFEGTLCIIDICMHYCATTTSIRF